MAKIPVGILGATGAVGQRFIQLLEDHPWFEVVWVAASQRSAKLPYADPNRMAAAGASYGGYMINWVLGHTQRFKALVSHDGVFDLRSEAGETEELWFPIWEFGGMPWNSFDVYGRWSPSLFVKEFRTLYRQA